MSSTSSGPTTTTVLLGIPVGATNTTTSADSPPSPSPTASYYYVSDPSVKGSVVLLVVAFGVTFLCILLYEIMRRRKSLHRILYTRVEACRRETPAISNHLFGWMKTVIAVPETFVIEKIGLDATMFLRFLRMSFFLFLALMIVMHNKVPILTPINYLSGDPSDFVKIVSQTDSTTFAKIGLYRFSISNVLDGSYYLYIHALCVLMVTVLTWLTLYRNYMGFADLASSYLRSNSDSTAINRNDRPSWRRNEDVQLRTVIVQNVPSHLRSDAKLKQWMESLGIGEVERALMDRATAGRNSIKKLLEKRERTLTKLEKVYMQWARRIEEEKARRKHYYMFGANSRKEKKQPLNHVKVNSLGQRLMNELGGLKDTPLGTEHQEVKTSAQLNDNDKGLLQDINQTLENPSCFLDMETVQKLRPKLKKFTYHRRRSETSTHNARSKANSVNQASTTPYLMLDRDDAIVHYTRKLSTLTAMVKQHRIQAFDPEAIRIEQENEKLSPTAFVTFKTQRSAQIAAQVLLYNSHNPSTMSVRLAPAPQDIVWEAVSMHPLRRRLQIFVVTLLAGMGTFFWIVPASFFASFTNLDQLAKVPVFAEFVRVLAENQNVYLFLKTIGPPVVVNIFNTIMPYILEFFIRLQGLEAHSWIEMETMSHYFFFLIFNVLLVFTLSSTVWTLIGSFFQNPLFIFNLMASTLPSGATFFINYIILNIMLLVVELCRPLMLIYTAFKRWKHKTPRELHEINLYTSYLNFGILYPAHLIIFMIVLCYSVLAPLILIPGTIYFGIAYLIYRNQLLYVYVKEYEAYGRHWAMMFNRAILGLLIFQVTMAGMFFTKGAGLAAIVPIVLIPMTVFFHMFCQDAFERRTRLIPLDQLPTPSHIPMITHTSPSSKDLHGDFKKRYSETHRPSFDIEDDSSITNLLPSTSTKVPKGKGGHRISKSTSLLDFQNGVPSSPTNMPSPSTQTLNPLIPPQGNETHNRESTEPMHQKPGLDLAISIPEPLEPGQRSLPASMPTSPTKISSNRSSPSSGGELTTPHGTKLSDVVVDAEETNQERYPISYLNPVFSRPLPRPWLPLTVAAYWELLPKYSSDGEEEEEDICDEHDERHDTDGSAMNVVTESLPVTSSQDVYENNVPENPFNTPPHDHIHFDLKMVDSPETFGASSVTRATSSEFAQPTTPRLTNRALEKVRRNTNRGIRSGSLSKGVIVVATKEELQTQDAVEADLTITADGRLEVCSEAPETIGDV
ncbi:hypothetical protein HDV05_004332 [Chytridiales sp. JEL 0842]|nr:hypothetical protein HDV05_004332 [Chytridiales sp. JEL 0842]